MIPVTCGCLSFLVLNFCLQVFSDVIITKYTPDLYDFDFFIRDDWLATHLSVKRPLKLPVSYVVIHHTPKTGPCYSLHTCGNAMRRIERQHIRLKFGGIGYNFCIGSEGGVYEGQGWNFKGTHADRANNHSIGICMIGNWEGKAPPKLQMDTLQSLLKTGVLLGNIRRDYKLIGHTQSGKTSCPGTALMNEISHWEHFAPNRHDFMEPTMINEYPSAINLPPHQENFRVGNTNQTELNTPYNPWSLNYY